MSRAGASAAERVYLELVAAYQSAIVNYIYRLVGDAAVSEDLTQDTFVKAWRALERLELEADSEPRRRAWLYRIAHNTATDHLRRRGRLRWLSLEAWREQRAGGSLAIGAARGRGAWAEAAGMGEALSAEDPAAALDLRHSVRQAMAGLSAEQREVLLLFGQAGMSAEEVAEVLGISPAAARKRRQRAREAFETAWAAEGSGRAGSDGEAG